MPASTFFLSLFAVPALAQVREHRSLRPRHSDDRAISLKFFDYISFLIWRHVGLKIDPKFLAMAADQII
jgi:hypothetical protein